MLLASFLFLSASLSVQPEAAPGPTPEDTLLEARRVYREGTSGPMIAEGDVRASNNGQFLRADKVIYDAETDEVVAIGNVAVRDEDGQLYFADEVILSSDLRNGVIEKFEAELEPRGTLGAALAIRRESGRHELRRAAYTLCDVCDQGLRKGRPTWQITANRLIQDEDEQVLRFRNALIELYGLPVLYLPYIEVPDPTVKRASGFLAPQLSNSTRTGVETEMPYYWAISDYQDLTFAPRYYELLGTLVKGEYRRNTHESRLVIQAGAVSPTNDLEEEPGRPDGVRWHWLSKYDRELGNGWHLNADIDGVSDKGYFLAYDIEPTGELQEQIPILRPDRLESNISVTRRTHDSFTDVSSWVFQTLRFNENQAFTAQALPRIRHEQSYKMWGGEVTLGGNFLSLMREDGLNSTRASARADYSAVRVTRSGHKFELFGQMRGDVYGYDNAAGGTQGCNVELGSYDTCREDLPRNLEDNSYTFARLLPTVGAEWSFPLARIGENSSLIIEPRIQAVIAPSRDDRNDIFNEDSQFFQFDTATLFDFNKGTGLDVWEDGSRLNFGLSAAATLGQNVTVNGLFGMQVRAEETDAFAQATGLGDKSSDYVGAVDIQLGQYIVVDNRFQIDHDDGSLRRLETSARGRFGPVGGFFNYLRIEDDGTFTDTQRDEFLVIGGDITVTKNISFAATQAQNLDSGASTFTTFAVRLANECVALSLRYRFDDSTIEGFEQDTEISMQFDIIGFN